MHSGNEEWLTDLRKQYPQCFDARAKVLEIGSLDINGSIRSFFKDCTQYVGVDKIAGPGVDVVADAAAIDFALRGFNVGVCFSVFEHTPDGFAILRNLVKAMNPPAYIILCWGAEGNNWHPPEPWALVPHADVHGWAAQLDRVEIVDAFFEGHRYDNCPGAYDMLLRVT